MKRQTTLVKRILVIVVTLAMVIDIVPVNAWAEVAAGGNTPTQAPQAAQTTASEAGNKEVQDQTPPASDAAGSNSGNEGTPDATATGSNAGESEQQNSTSSSTPSESNTETAGNESNGANSGEGEATNNESKADANDKSSEEANKDKDKDKEADKNKDAKDTDERPAFNQKAEVDGTTVEVHAEEGIFPKDAKLKVNKVTEGEQREATAAVEQQRDENQNVATSYTYDVRVEDKDGNEVQPPEGKMVEVSFTRPEVASSNLDTHVYHMREQNDEELVAEPSESGQSEQPNDALVAEPLEVKEKGATAKTETDGFSFYTVEFTYGKKRYVMQGDSVVPLASILEYVGLKGDVSAVEVSNSELFSVARDESGAWQVTAHQPFTSEEWMKVTIDDVTYEIVVTDATTVSTLAELQTALNGSDSEVVVSASIVVPSGTTLDGNGKTVRVTTPYIGTDGKVLSSGYSNYRVFTINSGSTVTIKNMTIMGGYDSNAGGIYNQGTLTLENVTITRSYRGLNNPSSATTIIKNSNIVRNVASNGGGLLNLGTLIMDGCSLSENRSTQSGNGGGAMENKSSGVLYANNTVIANNSSSEIGGAINNYNAKTYLMNCTVTGNVTTAQPKYGGGLGMNGGTLKAVNCIFMDNYYISGSTVTPSDIGFYSGNDFYLYNCLYGATVGGSPNVTNCKTETANAAAGYRSDGVLTGPNGTSTGFNHPALVTKTAGAPALYVPIKSGGSAASGGTDTYFSYSTSGANMSYGSGGNTVLVGSKSTSKVNTYYEGGTRASGVIGASGTTGTTKTYYTVKLDSSFSNGSVSGATVYGDTYESGTSVTVTASPNSGYILQKWSDTQNNIDNVSTSATYTFTVNKNITLKPTFVQHAHSWNFSANGATATINCTANGCPYTKDKTYNITIAASNDTYDGGTHGASVTKDNGCPSEATVSAITYTGRNTTSYNSTTAPKNAGDYTATATVTLGSTSKTITVNYTIAQKEVGIQWDSTTYTYNGQQQGPTATATELVSGDTCTVTVSGKQTNARESNYTATASSLSNANYKLPTKNTTKEYTIKKAALIVKAKPKTITYGDEPSNDGITYAGFVNGESETTQGVITGEVSYSYDYAQYDNVGTYNITPSGLTAANYNITYQAGALTVNKRAITVTAQNKSSEYGAALAEFSNTITNTNTTNTGSADSALVNNDTATVEYDCAVTTQSRVGEYPIVPRVTGSEKVLKNYEITYVNGTYTVRNSNALVVDATGYTGVYDGAEHGITVKAGYPTGETEPDLPVFYSLESFVTMANVDLIDVGEGLDNQVQELRNRLTEGDLKDRCTTDPTKTYNPGSTADTAKKVTAKEVDETPLTVYYLVLADNYVPVTGSREVVINRRPLTVTANDQSITYGNVPANSEVTYDGFINGENKDTPGVLFGTLSFDTDYRQFSDVGTYAITPKGLSVRNYELIYEPGTLTVNPRAATLTWSGNSFAYNGSQQGPKATVNTVNGDDVQPDGLTGTVLETEVGTYNASYTALSGAKAQNYVLANDSTGEYNWSITKVKNAIKSVEIADWTYGESANTPTCKAVWGADKAHYQYSSRPDQGFTDKVPTNAGTYYVKAIIDESEDYERAESAPVPFKINKADIAIAAYDATIMYRDGLDVAALTENANLNQVSGKPLPYYVMGAYKEGDDLGVTVSIDTPPTGTFQMGTYPIKVHWNGNPNYNCDEGDLVDGDYHVTATEVSATAIGYDGVYDGQPHGINISLKEGASEDDVTVYYREKTDDNEPLTKDNYTEGSTEPVTRKDVGLTEVYWYIAPKGSEGQGIWGMKGIYILPATLTVAANDHAITYGAAADNAGVTYSGFVEGESAENTGLDDSGLTFSYDDYAVGSDVGSYQIVPSGVKSNNYEVRYAPGTLTVSPLTANLVWPETTTFAYNGKSQGVTPTIENLREGDNVEVNVQNGVKTGVGEYYASAIGLSGTSAKNYVLENQGRAWNITQPTENTATVSITGWTYGAYDPQINAPKVTATWGAETATFSYSTTQDGTYTANIPTNAGNYYVKATIPAPATDNYPAATATQQFTITPAPLTIESQSSVIKHETNLTQEMINGKLPSVVVTGLVAGDTVADLGITQSVAEGSYTGGSSHNVTPSYGGTDQTNAKVANYSITPKNGSVTLTSSDVTFSATGYTGVYDGRAHGITVTLGNDSADAYVYYSTQELTKDNYATGTRNPNDASVTSTDVTNPEAPVTIYFYVAPKNALETGVSGQRTIVITKAPLVVQPEDQAITYGETPDAHAKRDDQGKLSKYGLLYNIPAGMPDGVEITADFGYTYDDYAQYGDVGNGTFSILPTAGKVTSTNFALTFVPGTLTVARKELTATWPTNNEVPYAGTEVSVQPTGLDGVVNSDDVRVDKVTGNTATEIGTYNASALTIAGTKADNYVLQPSSYEWKVVQNTNAWKENKAPSIAGWTYGSVPSTPTSEAQFGANTARYYYRPADSQSDDDWTLEVPKQAGRYTMRTVVDGTASYTGLDTKDTPDLLVPFTIQKASVKLVPENKTSKYGEDIVDLSCTTQPRLAAGDQIRVTLETKATPTSPVGQYEISVKSYEENPNYNVDSTAKGTYTITKADLPITSEGYEGVYDDAPHGITVTHDDTLAENDVTVYYSANELTLESFANEKTAGNVTTDPMDARVTRKDVGETTVYFYVESANYQGVPAYGHQTIKITPAPLTVTANPKTITFGDAPANDGVSYEGFVGDDQEKGQVEGEATFTYDYERFGNVGEYTITPSGLTSANYAITYATGKLTVEPRAITLDMIKLDPAEFAHDGSKKSPAVKLTFTHEDGTTYELQKSRDYQVSGATEGTDINTYTLTITGKGNFKDAQDQTWRITGGNETIIGEKTYGKGKVQVALDTPGGNLSQSGKPGGLTPDLIWSLLSPEEQEAVRNGATCKVYLVMQELDKPALGDVAALAYAASTSGTKEGMFFDVSLWKQIGNAPATRITSTGDQMISLEVGVPDKLKNPGSDVKREFGVARAHEGVGEIVSDKKLTTSDPVPFATNKFSGYALVYKDTKTNNKGTNTSTGTTRSTLAKTGDASVAGAWIAALVVAGVTVIVYSRKLRTR